MSDYIKRTLVKAQFTGNFIEGYPVSLCKTLIDEVPSIEAEQIIHAKWIESGAKNHLRCSNCDIIAFIALYPHGDCNYCPHCGAKMDKE